MVVPIRESNLSLKDVNISGSLRVVQCLQNETMKRADAVRDCQLHTMENHQPDGCSWIRGFVRKGRKEKGENEKCHLKLRAVCHSQGQCACLGRWGGCSSARYSCMPLAFTFWYLFNASQSARGMFVFGLRTSDINLRKQRRICRRLLTWCSNLQNSELKSIAQIFVIISNKRCKHTSDSLKIAFNFALKHGQNRCEMNTTLALIKVQWLHLQPPSWLSIITHLC